MKKELYTIHYSDGNHTSLLAWSFDYALMLVKSDGLRQTQLAEHLNLSHSGAKTQQVRQRQII